MLPIGEKEEETISKLLTRVSNGVSLSKDATYAHLRCITPHIKYVGAIMPRYGMDKDNPVDTTDMNFTQK